MSYVFTLYLSVSVFLSSLAMLFYQNINQILFSSQAGHTISLTFDESINADQAETKALEIKNKFKLKSAKVITPTEQYTDFIASFAMYNQGAFEAEEILKLIPFALELTLFEQQSREDIQQSIQQQISAEFFQITETPDLWLNKLKSFSSLIEGLGQFLFLFLFICSAMITAVTLRILVFQNEKRIQIQSYLGQSFQSVLRLYLFKTAMLCVCAIGFGFVLTYAGFRFVGLKISQTSEFSFLVGRLQFLDFRSVLILCFGFLAAFAVGSFFSYRTMYDRIYNED